MSKSKGKSPLPGVGGDRGGAESSHGRSAAPPPAQAIAAALTAAAGATTATTTATTSSSAAAAAPPSGYDAATLLCMYNVPLSKLGSRAHASNSEKRIIKQVNLLE